MRTKTLSIAGIALGLLMAVQAIPADAQGRGKGNGKRAEAERPVYEEREYREYREYGDYRDGSARRVPPGWCKGKGNPHNTPENCGYSRAGRYDDRYPVSRGGSYQREHEDFHYYLDRKYSELAARRPLDLQYQLRLRLDKKAEHDRWHARAGIRH